MLNRLTCKVIGHRKPYHPGGKTFTKGGHHWGGFFPYCTRCILNINNMYHVEKDWLTYRSAGE